MSKMSDRQQQANIRRDWQANYLILSNQSINQSCLKQWKFCPVNILLTGINFKALKTTTRYSCLGGQMDDLNRVIQIGLSLNLNPSINYYLNIYFFPGLYSIWTKEKLNQHQLSWEGKLRKYYPSGWSGWGLRWNDVASGVKFFSRQPAS